MECFGVLSGSIVFKWDVRTKSRADDYDLSHVVKQYQSCDSVSTTPISSLTYHCNKLLVTTTSGYLICTRYSWSGQVLNCWHRL